MTSGKAKKEAHHLAWPYLLSLCASIFVGCKANRVVLLHLSSVGKSLIMERLGLCWQQICGQYN